MKKLYSKEKPKGKGKLQKAANGLNNVAVPEPGNPGNIVSSGLAGASAGSIAGPWGTVLGGIAGVAKGTVDMETQDKANREAELVNRNLRASRAYDGVDVTIDQKMQAFKKGSKRLLKSKLVEAENREHVFDKNLNHKGIVKGKTHAKGGEVIEVEKGDSIFPAKHKEKIDKAIKTGNKKSLKKLRKTLPKDKGQKMQDGTGWVDPTTIDMQAYKKRNKTLKPVLLDNQPLYADNKNRVGQYTAEGYQAALAGLDNGTSTFLRSGEKGNPYPYSVVKNSSGTMWKHNREVSTLPTTSSIMPNSTVPDAVPPITPSASSSTANESGNISPDGIGDNGGGNPLKYANIANNLIRGFSGTPTIEQNYLNPELLKYQDRSEVLRRESRANARLKSSNARNLSGGLVSNIRSNQAAAATENLENQDAINEREVARADAVDNANVEIKNKAAEVNSNKRDYYQDLMRRDRAVSDQYVNTATQELAQLGEANEERNYQIDKDNKTLGYLNQTTRYQIDADGRINFNPDSQTGGSGSYPAKTTTTRTVDAKGRESTRTSTSSSPDRSLSTSIFGGRRLKRKR